MKKIILLALILLIPPANAEEEAPHLSDKCVIALRDVYKFYYHAVEPNPDPACRNNKLMDDKEQSNMNALIGELKNNCPSYLITQINQSLMIDKG